MDFSVIGDAYKYSHIGMYPNNMVKLYSVLYVRSPLMDLTDLNGHVVIYGVKNALNKLNTLFEEAKEKVRNDLDLDLVSFYGKDTFEYKSIHHLIKFALDFNLSIFDLLDIKHVPDGTVLGKNQAVITIENKHAEFCWLSNFIETFLNSEIWKSTFVATQCARYKAHETKFYGEYQDTSFNIHDFSARGMSGLDDACTANQAHLMFFNGTDTVSCVKPLFNVYPNHENIIIGSIPATEHSVMCSYGSENELETFKKLMSSDIYNDKMLSIVSDTWDLFGIIDALHNDSEAMEMIKNRKQPIVIRPDSGDPYKILCGDEEHEDTRYQKGVLRLVNEYFGFDKVRVVYGDSITPELCERIYTKMKEYGFNPSACLCLGVGSYSYNYATRDSVGFVTKATHATFDSGVTKNLIKNPKTGKVKKSITGRVDVKNADVKIETLGELRKYAKEQLMSIL